MNDSVEICFALARMRKRLQKLLLLALSGNAYLLVDIHRLHLLPDPRSCVLGSALGFLVLALAVHRPFFRACASVFLHVALHVCAAAAVPLCDSSVAVGVVAVSEIMLCRCLKRKVTARQQSDVASDVVQEEPWDEEELAALFGRMAIRDG